MRITFFPKENALHEPQGPCSSQGGENPTPLGSSPANPDLKGSLSQNSSLLSCNMKQYWRCPSLHCDCGAPSDHRDEPRPASGTAVSPSWVGPSAGLTRSLCPGGDSSHMHEGPLGHRTPSQGGGLATKATNESKGRDGKGTFSWTHAKQEHSQPLL